MIVALRYGGWLASTTALAFGLTLLKFGFLLARQEWYQTAEIKQVVSLETGFALTFLAIAPISLLPAHLLAPS